MIDSGFIDRLRRICGPDGVLAGKAESLVYECDAYTIEREMPEVVVLPTSTEQVAGVVRLCHEKGVPFVARGAGTGLSGGALPLHGGVVIAMTRMKRILKTDLRNRRMIVEAGAVNIALTRAVEGDGYQYAPDPSSQIACTIGGNVAENSGGPHTLKYGVTVTHVLGLTLVLPDGEVVTLGGEMENVPGYDLVGIIVGSEGTFGVVTEVIVRLLRQPQTCRTMLVIFDDLDRATETVSGIIAAGIIPAALELMDQVVVQAVEAAFKFGFPLDAGACLIVELDGLEAGIDRLVEEVRQICLASGAREIRTAAPGPERDLLWKARKRAFGAAGRLAPSNMTQDGVIPRTKLPQVVKEIREIGERHGLLIANVFHAGDGNLHPVVLFDERDPEQMRHVVEAGGEILRVCIKHGGTLTGEHGIGIEKSEFMSELFSPRDLDVMRSVKAVFNPKDLCNPGKIFPTGKGCIETTMHRRKSLAL